MSNSTIKAMTAGIILLVPFASRSFAAESTGPSFEFPPETYDQVLEVEFADAASASKATLELLPLYDGYDWAVSSRWDDNNGANYGMRDVLERHGYKATFYLGQIGADCLRNATTKMRSDEGLLKGGNSIGCHSLTHPMLGWCSRNRIFEEVAGDRMLWEAAANTRVVSFAAPFCCYMNEFEGDPSLVDMGRALERAGFYHVTESASWPHPSQLLLSPILPADGQEIDKEAERMLGDKECRLKHPSMSFAMHAWYRTPEAWAKFERQLDKYGRNPDWWYCNQNEYAAYRYQLALSKLGPPRTDGRLLRVTLKRPELLDCNEPTPLTLQVSGVPAASVVAVRCATAEAAPSKRKPESPFRFNLSHDRSRHLPIAVGMTPPNIDGRKSFGDKDFDEKFPGLKALLNFEGGTLRLAIENAGKAPLESVRVTYRLPLAWKEGVVRRRLAGVAPGGTIKDEFAPTLERPDYKFTAGESFYVAQIDFERDGAAGRLHAACIVNEPKADPSYPQGNFLCIGPVSKKAIDVKGLVKDLGSGLVGLKPWKVPGGGILQWRPDQGIKTGEDVELVHNPAGSTEQLTVFQCVLVSPDERMVEIDKSYWGWISHLLVNGENALRAPVRLRAGRNQVFIVAEGSRGCPVLVRSPGTSLRVKDVSFERPIAGETDKGEYVVPTPDPGR